MSIRFTIQHTSKRSNARVGVLHTPHGDIPTPGFVPVGTNACLKAIDPQHTEATGQCLMFCNTYHLLLQPGPEVIAQAGGLHRFMNRQQPIITDSGGFQVFSLIYGGVANELKSKGSKKQANLVERISEDGVTFRSYRTGERILLTPESSVSVQKALGADIIIPFDELPPFHISPSALKTSFDRTHRWEARSLAAHQANPQGQAMYAVIHGGLNPDLRQQSAKQLGEQAFDGYAIGGSLGQTRADIVQVLSATCPHIEPQKPTHLLGIGDLPSIRAAIPYGIDTFDSSYPTKMARHGSLILRDSSTLKITRRTLQNDFNPPATDCSCYTCLHYSRAYLHHLFKAHEPSADMLASVHNVHMMHQIMADLRAAILADLI